MHSQLAESALRSEGVVGNLRFHHLGVACRDLDAEEAGFAMLGYVREGPEFADPTQGICGRFLIGPGPRLELLRNLGEPGVLSDWIRKGVRFYHLAYETDALEDSAAALVAAGAKQVAAAVPAVAFAGRRIAFYMLRNLTLVELIGP